MLKKLCTIFCLLISLSIQAQNADVRVGQLINESNWFELEQTLKITPADSISPFLRQLATAMTYHYFNRPDSACTVLADLLNNHQQELGDQTMSMVILLSTNLARIGHYNDAADLLENLYSQLAAMGIDSTQIASYRDQVQQYRALAASGPFYQPLHKSDEYHIPMAIGDKEGQHSIEMDGSINGKNGRFLFDTGAGENLITPQLAKEYGLRSLETDITVAGVGGLKEGGYAIADTLSIGGMTWLNVPFAVIDTHTGHEEADKFNEKFQLPPVIGLPVMLCMQEIQLDFAHRELVIPAIPTPNPLGKSNLMRTETEGLQLKTADETGQPLYFHFDTGFYYTNMEPIWYDRHRQEVDAAGVPDSLRVAGIGGVSITRTYKLPQMKFQIGNGIVTIDSIKVNTGIDLYTGEKRSPDFSKGTEDGVLGLNALEKFSKVIINLKDMYMEAIPYPEKK
ncbi:retropepsin-like aspartic protease [Barnesiella viscericola]|uniref:retropepsin-like aspartic protease n=1 Tax=Barnesiella viscericola TaxID=397865 RepID=UPI0023576102|nr:retropepsin-like aspartic protease [Barnesiella viscericola]